MKKSYFESKYFCSILSTILCLFTQLSFGSGCPGPDQCWTTQDVIDERIDVYAQKALLEMFSNGGNEAVAASSMLYAVKCEQLDGIYLPNQQVPALRAQGYGGYWTIFEDTNDNSKCYKKTSKPTQKPIIVFRERIKSDRQAMSRSLSDAWYQCQIPITEARCYNKTLHDKIESIYIPECQFDRDCIQQHGKDYFCSLESFTCKYRYGGVIEHGKCKGKGECLSDYDCTSKRCYGIPGAKCGVCSEEGSPIDLCIERAMKKNKDNWHQCMAAEAEEAKNCVTGSYACAVSCAVAFDIKGCFVGCLQSATCLAEGTLKDKVPQCAKNVSDELDEDIAKCKSTYGWHIP